MATQPPLFYAGETAGTAENLNAWMQFLETQIVNLQSVLNIAPGSAGAAGSGNAAGLATVTGLSMMSVGGMGAAVGRASVSGSARSNQTNASSFALTASSASGAFSRALVQAPATAVGGSSGAAFSQPSSYGIASGGATVAAYGGSTLPSSYQVTGTSSAQSLSNRTNRSAAHGVGTSSVQATGAGSASESASGATLTQPSQQIYASTTPGAASTTFNTFSLPSNPGTPVVNGTADSTQTGITELYYQNHYVYAQNTANTWVRWVSAGSWTPVASPLPAPAPSESVEGTSVNTVGPLIYASSTPGTAAAASASVGNGLDTWAINSSAQLVHNGVADTTTNSVVLIYYHGHSLWQLNSAGNWWVWNGTGYPQSATSPYPSTPTINVATVPSAATNATFVVSGTYQDYAGGANGNLIQNSSYQGAVGAVAPATGTLPNGWSVYFSSASSAGMSYTVNGTGTDTSTGVALPSVNITISGTPAAGDYFAIYFGPYAAMSASTAMNLSGYIAVNANTTNWWYGNLELEEADANGGSYAEDTFAINNSTTLSLAGGSFTTQATTAQAVPSVHVGFLNAQASTVSLQIVGLQLNSGTTRGTFVSTPVSAAIPTLEYSDNNSGSYSSFSSTANVTATSWSFVHPPVQSVSSNFTVSVRDHNNTGVVGISQPFSVYTPGVTTLTGITLNGLSSGGSVTISGTQPSGTVVGQIAVAVTPGSFSGTLAVGGTNASSFSINASKQLVTAAVLAAGSYAVTITATQSGAAGSPLSATYTVVATAESQPQTTVTTVGPTITGSSTPGTAGSQLVWALANAVTSGATNYQVTLAVNGGAPAIQTVTTAATTLYYFNHTLFQQNSSGNWYQFNGTITSGQAGWTACYSPYPIIMLTNAQSVSGTTQYDGQVSVVGSNGISTDSFAPTTDNASDQLFLIQTNSNGAMLSYAAGPKSYSLSGTDAARFKIYNSGSNWYLQANNVSISAGTYSISITATY